MSEYVDAVTVGLESLAGSELVDGLADIALEVGRWRDVDDFAAVGAEEVMVMLGEVFGQFVPSELVVSSHAPDYASDLEVDEVAVCGAAGHRREASGYVADADWMTGGHEQVDNGTPASRVTLLGSPQTVSDLVV